MSYNKEDLIRYRLEKSKKTFEEAESLAMENSGMALRQDFTIAVFIV